MPHYVANDGFGTVKVTPEVDCLPPDCGRILTFATQDNALACASIQAFLNDWELDATDYTDAQVKEAQEYAVQFVANRA